jgi:deoxycytidylate deaminase
MEHNMTCAKQTVHCAIIAPNGDLAVGENSCKNPQEFCPRLPGEGYSKCTDICKQIGHAEITAIMRARELGMDIDGGTAVISGHYYVCEACARALRQAGIRKIVIKPSSIPDEVVDPVGFRLSGYPSLGEENVIISKSLYEKLNSENANLQISCRHEPYQGKCIHCDVVFQDGKPLILSNGDK